MLRLQIREKRKVSLTLIHKHGSQRFSLTKDSCRAAIRHEEELVKFICDATAYEAYRQEHLKKKYA